MEDKIEEWIKNNFGSGSDFSNGDGSGSGFGNGDGFSNGDGSGSGFGNGDGSGSGSGFGNVDGSGDDYGDGLKEFDGKRVHNIDGVNTIIRSVKDNIAKGYVLNDDFTIIPCYIAKGNGYFAHGETVESAVSALMDKYMQNVDEEELFRQFKEKFKSGKNYKVSDFYQWHHYLTGSCEMGRKAFMKNHSLNMDDDMTVQGFFDICKNDYGGDVIQKLEKEWKESEEK